MDKGAMRAVVVRSFGGPEALEVAEVPVPKVGPGQVRIRVEAAAVNPVDVATRAGALAGAGLMTGADQVGIGWDVAGIVEELGAGVGAVAIGDCVVGLSDRLDPPVKTQAEQVVLDVDRTLDAAVVGLPALDAVRGGGAFVSVIDGARPLPPRGIRVANVFVRAGGSVLLVLVP